MGLSITYPDTHYFYCDTVATQDTSYSNIHIERISYNSMIGAGCNYPIKNENILLGVKIGYYHQQESYNSIYDNYQSYSALISMGVEWFPFKFLCLRDGINIYLYNDIIKTNYGGIVNIYNSLTYGGEGSLGLGIKTGNHLRFDYSTNIVFDHPFKTWSLDFTYEF